MSDLAEFKPPASTLIQLNSNPSCGFQPAAESDSAAPGSNNNKGSSGSGPKASSSLIEAKRCALLLRKRSSGGESDLSVVIKDHLQPAREAKERVRAGTGVVYDLRMTEHFNPWDPDHPESPQRFTGIIERCHELGLLDRCVSLPPRYATPQELLSLHTPEHLQSLFKVCQESGRDLEVLEKFAGRFDSVYLNEVTNELALLACGSTISLVQSIMEGKVGNGMAIVRPPGHHAMKEEYCGYCFFNNVAVAAKQVLESGAAKRVLIVDFDVHHGQATQQMFYDDPRVLYFSTHRHEHGLFWPNLEESDYNWIGTGPGLGYNVNVPLNKTGMGNGDFLTVWHQVLIPLAYKFKPDLVIVSAGFDTALGCPEFNPDLVLVSAGFDAALGDLKGEMSVTPQCYPHLLLPLMGLANGKIAVVLEGGYCVKSLAEGAALTLRALLGDPCPAIPPIASPDPEICSTILNVRSMLESPWNLGTGPYLEPEAFEQELQAGTAHLPQWKYEWKEPKPVTYQTRYDHAIQNPAHALALDTELDRLKAETSLSVAKHRVGLVYDVVMLGHRNLVHPDHPETPERISGIYGCHVDFGLVERCVPILARMATSAELQLLHTQEHVLVMQNTARLGSGSLEKLKDRYNSVYFNKATYEAALHSAGSVLEAVDSVLSGQCQSAVCIVRPPGHHAEAGSPCGFCIFNNVGLAAKHAIETHGLKRVLIVDWDIHHGNGIQHMFEEDPRVLYVSLHRYDGGTFFPIGDDGNYDVVGRGAGAGFNVNIPWNGQRMGDTEYLAAFTNVILPIAYEFGPELVLVAAGFDAAKGDKLGGYKVTPEGYAHMTHLLSPLANGRLILALEGGYNLTSIAYSMTMCTKALLGDPLPPLTLEVSPAQTALESLRKVAGVQAQYWTVLRPFLKSLPKVCPVLPGYYGREKVDELARDMSELLVVADSVNGNPSVIPDPPPASGEPSLSLPRPTPPILLPVNNNNEPEPTVGSGERGVTEVTPGDTPVHLEE